jgi:hypothetical protein
MAGTSPIKAAKSYRDRSVSVKMSLRVSGYSADHAKIEAATAITTDQARELAAELVALADAADAKAEAAEAAKERRRKWADQEVAAGRMVRFTSLR